VDQLQSGASKREGWRTDLPNLGLNEGVLRELEEAKAKDVTWQGKCSGTVYVSHK
jgi:sphinganine-1-phosphate aldolase